MSFPSEYERIFGRLRSILEKQAAGLAVREDSKGRYSLDAPVGPATIQAWRGRLRSERIPVAWAEIGKSYVSYHVMGLYMNPKLTATVSSGLKKRMQGKTCFNFGHIDEQLFSELEHITMRGVEALRRGGFIA